MNHKGESTKAAPRGGTLRSSEEVGYNIGLLDVCHRPYEELCQAAIASHGQIYEVAARRVPPFSDAPEHVPMLY